MNLDIKTPPKWRKGQTIFNFFWWLQEQKEYPTEIGAGGRMADPFHIPDQTLEKLFDQFLEQHVKMSV